MVRIESTNNIIIDNKFYANKFDDCMTPKHGSLFSSKVKTYPVDLVALKFNWFFINYDDKRIFKFLRELINHEDINIYKIPTIKIIVEFLFIKYKSFLFKFFMPIFLI